MRVFLWAALVCFGVAVFCTLDPSALNSPAQAWGWGGAAAFIVDVLSGGYKLNLRGRA